jgi:hypothetical protein
LLLRGAVHLTSLALLTKGVNSKKRVFARASPAFLR